MDWQIISAFEKKITDVSKRSGGGFKISQRKMCVFVCVCVCVCVSARVGGGERGVQGVYGNLL